MKSRQESVSGMKKGRGETMGYYINPKNQTKEDFLLNVGTIVPAYVVRDYKYPLKKGGSVPVVLVGNDGFTAAAVMTDTNEIARFMDRADDRPKVYFLVPIDELNVNVGLPVGFADDLVDRLSHYGFDKSDFNKEI